MLFLFVRIVNNWFLAYIEQFFSLMLKKALKMQGMQMRTNYVDLHHYISSDALSAECNALVDIKLHHDFEPKISAKKWSLNTSFFGI